VEAASEDGTIQDPEVLRSLVKNHVGGIDPERNDLNVELKPDDKRPQRGDYWLAPKVRRFFRQWLEYGEFGAGFQDTPGRTSAFDTDAFAALGIGGFSMTNITNSVNNLRSGYYGDEPTLVQQLDDMIARIVVEDVDVFGELMTSRRFFVASGQSTLQQGSSCSSAAGCDIGDCMDGGCWNSAWKSTKFVQYPYNLVEPLPATEEGRWAQLPEDERAGVLTHPAWLAAHGAAFEDGPSAVHRGKWIRSNLLCEYVPPLSKVTGVEAMLVPSAPEKSARQRLLESNETNLECTWCHTRMNPLGHAFEMYNHAGFLRGWDHDPSAAPPEYQGAVHGSTVLDPSPFGEPYGEMPDPALHGTYESPIELVEALADSHHVKRCFVRQTFRFFMGRDEGPEDACTLVAMEAAYDEAGAFTDMLGALVTSEPYLYRVQDDDAVCE
jgi:hypothetical protein